MVVYDDGTPEPVRIFDHGVVYKDPETFGEYQLSYRTGDILSPKVDTYEPLAGSSRTSPTRSGHGGETLASAGLARDVVRHHRGGRPLAAAGRRARSTCPESTEPRRSQTSPVIDDRAVLR